MAVDDILAAIRAETDAEIERVRTRATATVEEILDRARAEAAAVEETVAASRDAAAAREAERIVNRARLVAARRVRAAAEAIYQDLLTEVRERLAGLRGSTRYETLLPRLLDEGLRVLPEASRVLVDPADRDRVVAFAAHHDPPLRVEPTLRTIGGVDLATDDGRFVRNTFEARLRRADGPLRLLAAEILPPLRGAP